MKNENNLFSEVKKFINNVSVGETFTTKNLIENVGSFEKSTWWKRVNGNPNYRTHSYKSLLRACGFIINTKKGEWKVEKHIPEWVNVGTLSFLRFGGKYDPINGGRKLTYNGLTKNEILDKLKEPDNSNIVTNKPFNVGDMVIVDSEFLKGYWIGKFKASDYNNIPVMIIEPTDSTKSHTHVNVNIPYNSGGGLNVPIELCTLVKDTEIKKESRIFEQQKENKDMEKIDFKVGDKVVFLGANEESGLMSAKKGATATVTETEKYLYVEWDRDGLDGGQMNGGYLYEQFELIKTEKSMENVKVIEKYFMLTVSIPVKLGDVELDAEWMIHVGEKDFKEQLDLDSDFSDIYNVKLRGIDVTDFRKLKEMYKGFGIDLDKEIIKECDKILTKETKLKLVNSAVNFK